LWIYMLDVMLCLAYKLVMYSDAVSNLLEKTSKYIIEFWSEEIVDAQKLMQDLHILETNK